MKYCLGVDIGGTTVKMALFTECGEMLDKWEIVTHTENEGITILSDISQSINRKLSEHGVEKTTVLGCGIGVPAPVSDEGIVNGSANLGWNYKEVKKEAEASLGIPVFVANDANVAALGEMWKGGGMGYQNLIMITLGTGVGGGLIHKGKMISGANGAGGEIGHVCVNYQEEEICGCGNKGCLEQYSSATGVVRMAKKRVAITEKKTLLHNSEITAKSVFDAAKENDEVACEVVDEITTYLGRALSNVAALVDPEVVVIGGGVSRAGIILLEHIEKHYRENMLFFNENVQFALATLGNDAGVYGAAKLVLG